MMFKNLAGVEHADEYIQTELFMANIPPIRGTRSQGEVPYSFTGQRGEWAFVRAWRYWMASVPLGQGLPLAAATTLHGLRYPILGEDEPWTFGEVIRVAGHVACPHPRDWAQHFDADGTQVILDPTGRQERAYNELFAMGGLEQAGPVGVRPMRFVRSLEGLVDLRSFVNVYHIDTQLGLNAFAHAIQKPELFVRGAGSF